jgi:hypothetical protein
MRSHWPETWFLAPAPPVLIGSCYGLVHFSDMTSRTLTRDLSEQEQISLEWNTHAEEAVPRAETTS